MKFPKKLSIGLLVLMCFGCASRPQADFEMFANNSIALHLKSLGETNERFSFWAWTDAHKKANIIALQVRKQLYNLKEISTIAGNRSSGLVTAKFRDGREESWYREELVFYYCAERNSCLEGAKSTNQTLLPLLSVDGARLSDSVDVRYEIRIATDLNSLYRSAKNIELEIFADEQAARFLELLESKRDHDRSAREAIAISPFDLKLSSQSAAALEKEAGQMRASIRIGTITNCGPVFELRLPLAGIQTRIGPLFIPILELYGKSAPCHFHDGRYIGK